MRAGSFSAVLPVIVLCFLAAASASGSTQSTVGPAPEFRAAPKASEEGRQLVVRGRVERVDYRPSIIDGKSHLSLQLDSGTQTYRVITPWAPMFNPGDEVEVAGEPMVGRDELTIDATRGNIERLDEEEEPIVFTRDPQAIPVQVARDRWALVVESSVLITLFLAATSALLAIRRQRLRIKMRRLGAEAVKTLNEASAYVDIPVMIWNESSVDATVLREAEIVLRNGQIVVGRLGGGSRDGEDRSSGDFLDLSGARRLELRLREDDFVLLSSSARATAWLNDIRAGRKVRCRLIDFCERPRKQALVGECSESVAEGVVTAETEDSVIADGALRPESGRTVSHVSRSGRRKRRKSRKGRRR